MSTYTNHHNPFKKYGDRFLRSCIHYTKDIYRKIMIMDMYERVFVIGLLVFLFLLLVSPLMVLSPNDDTAFSKDYIFLIGRIQLAKTAFVVLISSVITLARHLSLSVRNYIIEHIGFNNNLYLFSFFLLFTTLASFMSLGEMNNIVGDYTTMLRMHPMYYVIQILLIIMVGYCLYMLLYQSQGGFKGTIVGYHNRTTSAHHQDDMQGLFDNLKDS